MAMARALGVVGYRPERWSPADWARAYGSGQLDYFADLDELGRYSILVGYVQHFAPQPSVLDVGCGSGLLRAHLPEDAFGSYVGIDPCAEAIDRARRRADDRTTFLCCELGGLESEPFDVVVLNEVLYYAPSATALLDQVAVRLRAGGTLLTSMWRHPGDRALWQLLDRRFELVDAVELRNRSSRMAPRGWQISCHRRTG